MSVNPKIGLRGKLSILIVLVVLLLSVVLTLSTSRYLADTINNEYMHRAEVVAGFLEVSLNSSDYSTDKSNADVLTNVQAEINSFVTSDSEFKRISIYAATPLSTSNQSNGPFTTIVSSDQAIIGEAANSKDIEPIYSNKTTYADETDSADNAPDSNKNIDSDYLEMLAPLRTLQGIPFASVGVYLDPAPRDSLILSQQIRFAIYINLALISLLIILYFSLNRLLIKPVKSLTKATKKLESPEHVHKPLGMNRNDEIGDLAKAFDDMVDSLNIRDEEVKLLLEASVAVSSALNVNKILDILCEKISESQKVTYCRISLYDKKSESLVVMAANPTRKFSDWERGIGDSLDLNRARHHAEVLKSRKPTILRKSDQLSVEGSNAEWEWVLTSDTESALLLPIISQNEAIGVVTLGEVRRWSRTPFSSKKIEFYQTLMNQAAVAINNADLYEKTERNVKELSAMHKISQAFTSTLDYQEVVSVVAQRVGNLIGAQFASVFLADDDGRHLNIVASHNLSAEYVWTINRKRRILIGFGPIGMAYAECRPFSVTNIQEDESYAPWKHIGSIQGYSSLAALPLVAKGQSIGVICIYFLEPHIFKQHEMNLLITAANEAAIAIENSRIYENLQDAFVGTIRSLAETIDAKDTYTRGHSERVSLYGEAIARGLGLQGAELQTIRYAGYLHDVGKIGIPDAILSKPGKLTVEEFNVIKKHPVLSEKILKPVNFPFPVQSIVRHHHERYDGKGYPDSLKAEEIPLGARILFVADAYEAMTSDRPYRKALSTQMALNELEKNMQTQFDSRVVEVFSKIIKSEGTTQRESVMEA